MKFKRFLLNEEGIITSALKIPEPEIGGKYEDIEVEGYLKDLKLAIDKQKKIAESAGDDRKDVEIATLKDLTDKLEKWENWEEEVKAPERPVQEPPEGQEPPQQQQGQEEE